MTQKIRLEAALFRKTKNRDSFVSQILYCLFFVSPLPVSFCQGNSEIIPCYWPALDASSLGCKGQNTDAPARSLTLQIWAWNAEENHSAGGRGRKRKCSWGSYTLLPALQQGVRLSKSSPVSVEHDVIHVTSSVAFCERPPVCCWCLRQFSGVLSLLVPGGRPPSGIALSPWKENYWLGWASSIISVN